MGENSLDYSNNRRWENLYLIIYGVIVAHDILDATMFNIQWPPKTGLVLYFAIMVYTLAMLCFNNQYSKKELICAGVVLAAFVIAAVVGDNSFLFEVGFLIVGAKNIHFDRILKVFFGVSFVILAAAMICSQTGMIENLVYPSVRGGVRQCFGTIYPTDFAAHVFYMAMAALCVNNRRIHIADIVIVGALGVFVYKACSAFTGTMTLGLAAIGMIVVMIVQRRLEQAKNPVIVVDFKEDAPAEPQQKAWRDAFTGNRFADESPYETSEEVLECTDAPSGWWNGLLRFLTLAPVFFAALFIGMVHLYRPESAFWAKLDQILSLRLSVSAEGTANYAYRLFGQHVEEFGNGRSIETREHYFFLDDSYLRMALIYGIVILIVVLLMMIIIANRAVRYQRCMLYLAMLLIALHCFMEQHLLEMAFNPFILGMFADMNWERKIHQK